MGCKISIITITYNSEKTLRQTIESVISQKYDNIEYIIIDGGSEDCTLEIVEQYKTYVSYIKSEPDQGICDAFNKGISIATGDIIGIINSDDMLCQGALQYVADVYNENIDVIYGNGMRLHTDGTMEKYIPKKLSFMKYGMALVHPATFVTRKAYNKYGLFDLRYKGCMDRELLLRMLTNGAKFWYIDKCLSIYRMGGYSDENYFRTVARERDELSLRYGANPLFVFLISLKLQFVIRWKSMRKKFKSK